MDESWVVGFVTCAQVGKPGPTTTKPHKLSLHVTGLGLLRLCITHIDKVKNLGWTASRTEPITASSPFFCS